MTVKLINQKIFEGNTKVLDNIIHVCIGGNWYKLFVGGRIRDVKYTEEGMEFTSEHISPYYPSMRYLLDGSKSAFVISKYNSPPMRGEGVLIKAEDVLSGAYIDTGLNKHSRVKPTTEELNRQIVWIEPNFEVIKENENESNE